MGYRNETEHLRHRVEQLEGELETLKGARRAGKEHVFEARAKRQTLLIAVLAVLASLTAGACLLPTTMIALEFGDAPVPIDEVTTTPSYARLAFRGTLDVGTVFADGYHVGAVPLAEDPRVIVACTWSCPLSIERDIEDRVASEHDFFGTVYEQGNYEFDRLDSYALAEHAAAHGLEVSDLRLVVLDRHEDPRPPLFMILFMLAISALALWGALVWHRRAIRGEVALPTTADYVTRDPGATLILTIVTCRLYELIWIYLTTAQLRRLTGRPDLNPGLDVLLTLMTFGLWSFWVFYRNVEAVDEALEETGYHVPRRSSVVGLTFGSFVCGILHWVLLYKVQETYNLLVVEKMDADDL